MDKEKKDKVKGICGTLLFHAVLLFLLSLPFMSLSYEDPPTREGGGSIAISFIKENNPPTSKEVTEDVPEEVTEEVTKEVTEEVPEEVPEESKDVITSDEGEIEVADTKKEKTPSVIKLTDEEKKFDKDNNGVLNDEEKKAHETNKIIKESLKNKEYKDNKENWYSLWNGKGKGKDGKKIGRAGDDRKPRQADEALDCPQNKETGKMFVVVVIDADGNIVNIYKDSFKSKIEGVNNLTSSDTQIEKLLKCIKEKYKVTAATGDDKDNKLYPLELNFKN